MKTDLMEIVNKSIWQKKHEEYLHKKLRAKIILILAVMAVFIALGVIFL